MKKNNQSRGFTLLEMLLVIVVMSAIAAIAISIMQKREQDLMIDRASLQTQQILNAALSYYVNNGSWPASLQALQTASYLPSNTIFNPWNGQYGVGTFTQTVTINGQNVDLQNSFAVWAYTFDGGNARVLAGRLPLAYTIKTTQAAAETTPPVEDITTAANGVLAAVNIPGTNLNNATAINFAGYYHNGACVPAPHCPPAPNGQGGPTTAMVPEIFVTPAQVSGTIVQSGVTNYYPITNMTAYYYGAFVPPGGASSLPTNVPTQIPADCKNTRARQCVPGPGSNEMIDPNQQYWRVCLDVNTSAGHVDPTNPTDGQKVGVVLAMTRCKPNNEPIGSGFTIWQQ